MSSTDQTSSSSPASSTPPAPQGLFVRDASGLVREMGTRDASTIGLTQVNPATGLTVLVGGLAIFPRSDLLLPLIIAAGMSIVLSIVYAQLTAIMPRSGGDYIFISRILNPVLGSVVGVAVLWSAIFSVGTNALLFGQLFFPFMLSSLGSALHISALTTYGATVSASHTWQFAWGILTIIIAVGLTALSVRTVARSSFWMMAFGLFAFIVLVVEFALYGHSTFVHAFNHASVGKNAYAGIIAAAAKNGVPRGVTFSASFSAVSLMILIWFGTTYPAITGGELRRPGRTMLRGQMLCIGISLVCYIVAYEVFKGVLGFNFFQASSGLSSVNGAVYGKLTSVPAFLPAFGLLVMGDPVSKIVVGVGLAIFNVALVVIALFVGSRLCFALSFDRLLPARLASVDSRRNAPVWAAGFIGVLAAGLLYAYVFSSSIDAAFRNGVLIFATDLALVSLAGVVVPFVRRGLWEASPKILRGSFMGIPVFTFVSALSFVLFALVVYLAATKTQISGGYSTTSVITVAASPIVGLVLYVGARLYWRYKGLNLALTMHELPPD